MFGQIDADVMTHANTYLLIVTTSIRLLRCIMAAAILQVMGNSKVSMQSIYYYECDQCDGNAVLIFGFHRGTEGVAILH